MNYAQAVRIGDIVRNNSRYVIGSLYVMCKTSPPTTLKITQGILFPVRNTLFSLISSQACLG